MKKIFSFLFLLLLINLAATAQQDPQFSQYMSIHSLLNPGAAGNSDALNISVISRMQWLGFPGAPETNIFGVDVPFKMGNSNHGAGFWFMSDKWGYFDHVAVNLSYAYRKIYKTGSLGIGLYVGFFNYVLDPTDVGSAGDHTQQSVDDSFFPTAKVSSMAMDLGFGVFYKNSDYYVGGSMRHINQPKIEEETGTKYFLTRHYYLTGGYNIETPSPLFEVQPSVFIQTDISSLQIDLTGKVVYDNKHWGGIGYRIGDGIIFLAGTELIEGLRVSYSFDLTTSKMSLGTLGSHEFFIGYTVVLQRKRNKKYKSVRYL